MCDKNCNKETAPAIDIIYLVVVLTAAWAIAGLVIIGVMSIIDAMG